MGRAMGPGPGAYLLPSTVGYTGHDPSRYRNPMYSFGAGAAGKRVKFMGPGPAYRIDGVTRDGVVSSPAWSFGARFPMRSNAMRTPGPGAHAPERCPEVGPRAPLYSMGARLGRSDRRGGPAPNAYSLRTGPSGPAYTMGGRIGFAAGKSMSPGPAVYFQQDGNVYMNKPPVYSLGGRLPGIGRLQRTPGPAAYPPNLYDTKKNPYSYSFGTKHAEHAPPLIIKEDTMDCL